MALSERDRRTVTIGGSVVGNLKRWSSYRPWHPLDDEPDVAVQVWAFARSPA